VGEHAKGGRKTLNKLSRFVTVSLCATALVGVASAATVLNPSFEAPATSAFIYNPVDPTGGWTFSGRSGVASTTFFTPPPPDGSQAAFLQQASDQSSPSTISQLLTGVALAPALLSFFIADRPDFPADPITVMFGSQNLGTFTPPSTAFTKVTINFIPTATSGQLTFRSAATTNGDIDTALDMVTFSQPSAVPEPGSALFVLPGLWFLAIVWRSRAKRQEA
jgi:hypothetical protein